MIALDTIHNLDCFELLSQCDDHSVDMILTDAPYNVHEAAWESAIDLDRLWSEFKRIIKPRQAIVMTAQQPFTTDLIVSNRAWFKYSWVWVKSRHGDIFNAKNKPMRQHEDILIFSEGTTANGSKNMMPYYPQGLIAQNKNIWRDPEVLFSGGSISRRASWKGDRFQEYTNYPTTILDFPFGNNGSLHPNAKPLDLFSYLIKTYTLPGATVLDCFAGSFTTAVAARNCGRHWICGDITPAYCEVGRKRLDEPPMFADPLPTQRGMFE